MNLAPSKNRHMAEAAAIVMREGDVARQVGAMMHFFLEDEYANLQAGTRRRSFALDKYRKLLAILDVSLLMPIEFSRYMPEVIALTWFFGLPSFGKEQDRERLRRLPFEVVNPKDLDRQRRLFDDGLKGDPGYQRLFEMIRRQVQINLDQPGGNP